MAVKIKKEWVCEKCGESKTDDSNLLGAIMKNRYPAGWAKMVRFGNSKPVTKKIIVCPDCVSAFMVKTPKSTKKGDK
jgi:hypothetical protein